MINSISLENYKCFQAKQTIDLSQITIMYGKNGRGKSSVSQALLLLAQTMHNANSVDNLYLKGAFVQQGTFEDVQTQPSVGDEVKITLKNEQDNLQLAFSKYEGKPQLAKLSAFVINGNNKLGEKTQADSTDKADYLDLGTNSDVLILQNLKDISYISAGRVGPINSMLRNDTLLPDNVGVNGEYLINVLANQSEDFIKEVEKNLSKILSGASIAISETSDVIELKLNSKNGGAYFRPMNVGFGYSYVLPIIVSTLLAKEGSIVIIENPEAHLHPGAQSRLMTFIIEQALQKNLQVILETHSDHVINGLRIATKQEKIKPSQSNIVYFANEDEDINPKIEIIKCDKNGTLSDYPEDFMDEWTLQLLKLV